MRSRLYLPGTADARIVDELTDNNSRGDIRLDRDRIVVAHDADHDTGGDIHGLLVWRPSAFIHELRTRGCLSQRGVADTLFRDAVRMDVARRHRVCQAVFLVDNSNAPMLRYVRGIHGIAEQAPNQTVFLLNLDLVPNLAPKGK